MSTPIEGIVRPFQTQTVTPTPFTKPGAQGSQMVRVAVGFQGAIKTTGYSFSLTYTSKMGQAHTEKPPDNSEALKAKLAKAAE